MKILNVVVPMAGEGKRFQKAGITTSKPLIPVNGAPMFYESLKSLEVLPQGSLNYIFVVLKKSSDYQDLTKAIKDFDESAIIVALDNPTHGSAESVMQTESFLDTSLPLLILDCDIRFYSREYLELLSDPLQTLCDGALLSFQSSDPRFSYLQSRDEIVTKTVEKNAISNDAIIGAYYFAKSKFFFDSCRDLLEIELSDSFPEYYISGVYNLLIAGSYKVSKFSGKMDCFGTPEELEVYLKSKL